MPALLVVGALRALSSPPPSLELCSATTRYLHFCKVMSSADNGFSVSGGAGVPDIALWGRGSEELIVYPSGMGGCWVDPLNPPIAMSKLPKADPWSQASWSPKS